MRFTLTELLVTIVILAILAALLLPAIGKARENGRRAQCRTILSQYAAAIQLYGNDYQDFFPFYKYDDLADDFSSELRYLWWLLSPYLPYSGLCYGDGYNGPAAYSGIAIPLGLACPSAVISYEGSREEIRQLNLYVARPTRGGVYQTALLARHYLPGGRHHYGGLRLANYPQPSTYFFMEDAGFNDRTDDREFPYWKHREFIDGKYEWGHGTYFNVAFLDGHVTPYQRKRRLQGWEAAYTRNFTP
ncbi:hypothetical protein SDC9_138750 [bioreactor metagenome]|uniref:DUF1559 domain-containing protein n=1 Tax=bioreactor metagenome TaxID=1076179 RepID=A0A645DQT6_9ZZZZ